MTAQPRSEELNLGQRRMEALALLDRLTSTERAILKAVVAGHSKAEIGTRLKLADAVLDQSHASMMQKLRAGRAADVVRIGLYAGLGS